MITLKKLKWGNFRSYGEDNCLNLNTRNLTQLVGDNGAGKTTIPFMLQEVLYGKNIKGIKKDALSNRYTDTPGYYIYLTFSKDNDQYEIRLNRLKTKVTVSLTENGEDISSHTATGTYKTIAGIIGIPDFKTFCQLTYQSTTDSLDFLTATDTTRKRFLISLLDLSQYLVHHETLKKELKVINKDKDKAEGAKSAVETWLVKNKKKDLTTKVEVEVPNIALGLLDEIASIRIDLDNITKINKDIVTNNKYRKDADALGDVSKIIVLNIDSEPLKVLEQELTILRHNLQEVKTEGRRLEGINTNPVCPTCKQSITVEDVSSQKRSIKISIEKINTSIQQLLPQIANLKRVARENEANKKILKDYEYHMSRVDLGLSSETLDEKELTQKMLALSQQRVSIQANIDKAIKFNNEVHAHNSVVKALSVLIKENETELKDLDSKLSDITEQVAYLTILRDAFSTNGLVSYKVEASIKVLETAINSYLAEFSEFRLRFKLTGDKLNVEIFDDFRNIIDISTVSTGELNRINMSTGLAIRKLLSTLTTTRINFLFLDEIVGTLDSDGKEKLFEILQNETLNTLMVAHEETHPLIPKLEIEKVNNMSRLIDD